MIRDLRLAWRGLRREPLLSVLVVVILAASFGLHTAVVALLNAAFLRPLPHAEADRMVVVETVSTTTGAAYGLSMTDADDLARDASALTAVGAYEARRDNLLLDDGEVVSIPSAFVTTGVLPATGVRPVLGRLFEAADDSAGGDSFQAVLGHSLWRSRFNGDSGVVGQRLRTSLGTYTVIGVLPPGFGFPNATQLWLPAQNWIDTQDVGDTRENQRAMRWFRGIARRADGVDIASAQAEIETLAAGLAERFPETNRDWQVRLSDYRTHATAELRPHLRALSTIAWVFLVLAMVNLAGLQLARGLARASSFAMQAALGAGGATLGRQLLIETAALVVPGAALGLLLAHVALRSLPGFVGGALPAWIDLRIGWPEIGVMALLALAVTGLAGLAPLVAGRLRDFRSLIGGRSASSRGRRRLRTVMVVVEVALATVLLVAASLLARSFRALDGSDPGFDHSVDHSVDHGGLTAVELAPQHTGSFFEQIESLAAFYARVQSALQSVPGVRAVGGATHLPYLDRDRRAVTLEARGSADDTEQSHQAPILTVDVMPGYFEAMGIPLHEGRDFAWNDDRANGKVIVLSASAAERLFPGQSAIGQEARIASDAWARVIGVVGDVRYDPRETGLGAELYYPISQYKAWRLRVVIRHDGPTASMVPQIRQALAEAAPEAGVVSLRPLEQVLAGAMWQSRLLAGLVPFFAVVALVLAGLAIYGLLAHDVAQRRAEMGIRAALGASQESLAGAMFGRGARLIGAGLLLGVAGALAVGPMLSAAVYGVGVRDPSSFGLGVLVLIGAGALGCLRPALEARRVDPSEALRDVG